MYLNFEKSSANQHSGGRIKVLHAKLSLLQYPSMLAVSWKWKLEKVVAMMILFDSSTNFSLFTQIRIIHFLKDCGPVRMMETKEFSNGVKSIHTLHKTLLIGISLMRLA